MRTSSATLWPPYVNIVFAKWVNNPPSSPTGLLCEGQTNPQHVRDLTPEFSAIYNDPDSGDKATHAWIQVATDSGFNNLKWNSGWIDIADVTEGNRCQDISYGGSALSWCTTYYWRIRFKDQAGATGAWSSTANFKTECAPAAPSDVTAHYQATDKALVTWTDNADNEEYYDVQYRVDGGSWQDDPNSPYPANTTCSTAIYIGANKKVEFQVRARNVAGSSSWVASGAVYTTPAAPTNLSLSWAVQDETVTVSWTKNAAYGDTQIDRRTDGGSWTTVVYASGTSYDDTGPSGLDHKYEYRVRARTPVSDDGTRRASPWTTIKVIYSTPNAPSGLQVGSNTGGQVELEWTDNSQYEEGFAIERSVNGGAWQQVDTVGAGVTSWTDTSPGSGTNDYRVRAYIGSLYSAYSNTTQAGVLSGTESLSLAEGVQSAGASFQRSESLSVQEALGQATTEMVKSDELGVTEGVAQAEGSYIRNDELSLVEGVQSAGASFQRSEGFSVQEALGQATTEMVKSDELGVTEGVAQAESSHVRNDGLSLEDVTAAKGMIGQGDSLDLSDAALLEVLHQLAEALGLTELLSQATASGQASDGLNLEEARTLEALLQKVDALGLTDALQAVLSDYTRSEGLQISETAEASTSLIASDTLSVLDVALQSVLHQRAEALGLTDLRVALEGLLEKQEAVSLTELASLLTEVSVTEGVVLTEAVLLTALAVAQDQFGVLDAMAQTALFQLQDELGVQEQPALLTGEALSGDQLSFGDAVQLCGQLLVTQEGLSLAEAVRERGIAVQDVLSIYAQVAARIAAVLQAVQFTESASQEAAETVTDVVELQESLAELLVLLTRTDQVLLQDAALVAAVAHSLEALGFQDNAVMWERFQLVAETLLLADVVTLAVQHLCQEGVGFAESEEETVALARQESLALTDLALLSTFTTLSEALTLLELVNEEAVYEGREDVAVTEEASEEVEHERPEALSVAESAAAEATSQGADALAFSEASQLGVEHLRREAITLVERLIARSIQAFATVVLEEAPARVAVEALAQEGLDLSDEAAAAAVLQAFDALSVEEAMDFVRAIVDRIYLRDRVQTVESRAGATDKLALRERALLKAALAVREKLKAKEARAKLFAFIVLDELLAVLERAAASVRGQPKVTGQVPGEPGQVPDGQSWSVPPTDLDEETEQ